MLLLLAALQAVPKQDFPEINRPGTFADLRGSVERACGVSGHADLDALLKRERDAAWEARGSHVPADKLLALGCARGVLAGERALSHDGPLMAAGNSWAQGAERAMQAVLAERPGDARAAEVLGLLALDDNVPDDLKPATASLLAAVDHGVKSAAVFRACAELGLRTFAETAAKHCSEKALVAGTDSTWHLMRLAQLAFRVADTAHGGKLFTQAANVARDSFARQEVNWHLQWFLTPEERKAWLVVPDSGRGSWIRDKVIVRDVRDGQPLGARLAEHFNRLEYVEAHFRLEVSRRTREMLRTGPAAEGTLANDDAIRAQCEAGMVLATEFRFYKRWQTDYDDRGVVWMRFGPPAVRNIANPVCREGGIGHNHREIWAYNIDGQALILSFETEMFSGSVEATRLVEGVLGSYFCGVDTRRCNLTELSYAASHGGGELIHPETIVKLHHEDAEYISAATTKDDNSVRTEHALAVVSGLHRLWDPISSAPIALVTYALPINGLAVQVDAGTRTAVVHLEVRQWDSGADHWTDTAMVRRFTLPDTSLKRPNLVGFLTTASTPGVNAWSVVASQSDDRRGRAYDVSTPGLSSGPLALSDLVLGAEAQGVTWNLHNVAIPLAPTGAVDRKAPVSLYYQIRSDVARADLRTTVAVYRVEDGVAKDSAALQVAYDQTVQRGINEVAPTLDVSRLDKGSYRLEVRLTDTRGAVLVRRHVMLVLD
jgi:hypothetical protein